MGRILLMNFDEQRGAELADALRRLHHSVLISASRLSYRGALQRSNSNVDLVIINFSQNEPYALALMEEIVEQRTFSGVHVMILCVMRVYRGPQLQLKLERKGARVEYVT